MHTALPGEVSVSSINRSTCKLRRADSWEGMEQALLSKGSFPGLCGAMERVLLCPQFLPKRSPHEEDAIPQPSAIPGHPTVLDSLVCFVLGFIKLRAIGFLSCCHPVRVVTENISFPIV